MKKVGLIAALAALLCGVAVYFYMGTVEQRIAAASEKQRIELTQVVVANQLIPPYTEITEEMLRLEEYPANFVNKQAAKEVREVVGLRSDGTIVEGELLLTTMLGTSEEVGAGLSYVIPDGMRAMTVSVELDSGVGGYIAKGDLIDLMLYLPVESETGRDSRLVTKKGEVYLTKSSITTIVLEAAEVLEIGDASFDPAVDILYTGVTLALTPDDCLKLFAATEQANANAGRIYATLRQRDDTAKTDTGIYSTADLLNK